MSKDLEGIESKLLVHVGSDSADLVRVKHFLDRYFHLLRVSTKMTPERGQMVLVYEQTKVYDLFHHGSHEQALADLHRALVKLHGGKTGVGLGQGG